MDVTLNFTLATLFLDRSAPKNSEGNDKSQKKGYLYQ